MYNKFLSSRSNIMNIQPMEPNKINTYYVGVFKTIKNAGTDENELIECIETPTGSRIEDYFPLVVDCLNRRGNWKCLTTEDAKKIHSIDFCWSNASKINTKSNILSRFLLDSIDHYISNKRAFYEKFEDYDFIPKFESINKKNLYEKKDIVKKKFKDIPIIIKPDCGSISNGIIVQDKLKYKDIIEHILNSEHHDNWTISQVIKPRLHNGYIVTNRIYFLVSKRNNEDIKSYYYKHIMNYRAEEKFQGDITCPEQFLTNFMNKQDPLADEKFVKDRYVPHQEYLNNFTQEEQEIINSKLSKIFYNISKQLCNDILCHNDNKLNCTPNGGMNLCGNETMGFHVYGVDAIITDDLDIKIIEINGAPAMNVKTRYYELCDRLDYFDLFEELFQKVVDPIFPPKNEQSKRDIFELVFDSKNNIDKSLPTYYISHSVTENYPFILDAFRKRPYLRRTKNFHDKIDIFYGLRERYVTNDTSMNYYDELLNYLTSKRTRDASVVNKVQGITYYLANKGRMYNKLLEYKGDEVHKYHPTSELLFYDDDIKKLKSTVFNIVNKYQDIETWILKPVHGSRGLGIKIFKKISDEFWFDWFTSDDEEILANNMVDHIIYCSEHGFDSIQIDDSAFDGTSTIYHKKNKYRYWMMCQYIDKPHLIKLKGDALGRKYNIRFYVHLSIDKKIPTYEDISTFDDHYNIINTYIFDEFMIYFSMLEYNAMTLPAKYSKLDEKKYLHDMKNLTNLEIVNKSYDELKEMNDPEYMNKDGVKFGLTTLLSNTMSRNSDIYNHVKHQATKIVEDTINSVKYDLRPINRHKDNFKGCFNLLAYDSMLDENNNLWLIEINRGPDIKGLQAHIGDDGCLKMFDEMFKISIDPHYGCEDIILDKWKKIHINYDPIKKN